MRVELDMHKNSQLGEWAVITNTNGAGNLTEPKEGHITDWEVSACTAESETYFL